MSAIAVRPSRGLVSLAGTTDHKRLGIMIVTTAFLFFLGAGSLAVVMRTELAAPGMQFLTHHVYNQFFTLHGSAMIFLVMVPLGIGLGMYFVPLQVGAAGISGPRIALFGYWIWALGGLLMYSGFVTDHGAASAGWFSYVPLSDESHTPGFGMDLWVIGVWLTVLAGFLWSGCLLATVLRRRAPGMTMLRIPPFTWGMVVTAFMALFAFPALLVAFFLLYLDRHGANIYSGTGGAVDYQELFWFFGHPVVYLMFFPYIAVVFEVIAVFSRKKFFGYKAMVLFSFLLFGAFSMNVWSHHMFATGHVANRYFALTSTAILVAAGIEYFDSIATMFRGSILLRTPMLFAIMMLVQFLIGGFSGVFTGSPPLDYHVTDSYVVVGHIHYVLFAGSLFGFFAGVYYWFPKVTGLLYREGLGKLHWALITVGGNLTFFPMFFLGQEGMPRRVADYSPQSGWQTLNLLETVGSYIILVSIAVFIVNMFLSVRDRRPAGPDPWFGHTLEWWTSSPPPRFNFETPLPPIRSFAPVWDLRLQEAERAREEGRTPEAARAAPAEARQ